MASYGFVYILMNDYMPRVFKLGCTERAPSQRAEEVSGATGVPGPFMVACYAEMVDFQRIERELHARFDEYRVSSNREFFDIECLELAVAAMFFNDATMSFCDVELSPQLWQRSSGKVSSAHQLPNPFAAAQPPAAGLRVA
jgi:hypothetical protein